MAKSYRNMLHQARFQVIHSARARSFDEGQLFISEEKTFHRRSLEPRNNASRSPCANPVAFSFRLR
jgi:hypothetical protein